MAQPTLYPDVNKLIEFTDDEVWNASIVGILEEHIQIKFPHGIKNEDYLTKVWIKKTVGIEYTLDSKISGLAKDWFELDIFGHDELIELPCGKFKVYKRE